MEPSDKKREVRVGRACDQCRKAKVKCLGGSSDTPCARCKSTDLKCTFEERAAKRGPPRGYIESLERKVQAMEKILQHLSVEPELIKKVKSNTYEDLDLEDNFDSADEDVDGLIDDMAELTVDTKRYLGRGSGYFLAKSLEEIGQLEAPVDDVNSVQCPSLAEKLFADDHRLRSQGFTLPPPDLSDKLQQAYFSKINDVYPLLHYPSFKRDVDRGLVETDVSFRSLFYMICAVGSRFVEDQRVIVPFAGIDEISANHSRGFEFFRAAILSGSPPLLGATLYDLQASVLGVFWLLGAATPISAWATIGFAIRRAVDVGAHRAQQSLWTSSPLKDQLRRRACMTLFGLDRLLSSSLGRPLAIHEEDYDIANPVDITDEELDAWDERGPKSEPVLAKEPTSLGSSKCMNQLLRIMSKALKLLYGMHRKATTPQKATEIVTDLDSLLNQWLSDVPDHLRWDPERKDERFLIQSIQIYAIYYTCQILVHRDFITPGRAKLHKFPSLAICSNAARSCAHILDLGRRLNVLDRLFHVVPLAAMSSALVLLIGVFSNNASSNISLTSSAMSDVKKCLDVLESQAASTFVAHRCMTTLRTLTDIAISKANTPFSTSLKRDSDWTPSTTAGSSPEHEDTTYKRRKTNELPFTTDDLSAQTFKGHSTFTLSSLSPISGPSADTPLHRKSSSDVQMPSSDFMFTPQQNSSTFSMLNSTLLQSGNSVWDSSAQFGLPELTQYTYSTMEPGVLSQPPSFDFPNIMQQPDTGMFPLAQQPVPPNMAFDPSAFPTPNDNLDWERILAMINADPNVNKNT